MRDGKTILYVDDVGNQILKSDILIIKKCCDFLGLVPIIASEYVHRGNRLRTFVNEADIRYVGDNGTRDKDTKDFYMNIASELEIPVWDFQHLAKRALNSIYGLKETKENEEQTSNGDLDIGCDNNPTDGNLN